MSLTIVSSSGWISDELASALGIDGPFAGGPVTQPGPRHYRTDSGKVVLRERNSVVGTVS